VIKVLAFCDYLQEPMGGGAEIVSAEVYRRLASSGDLSITVLSGVNGRTGGTAVAGPDVEIRQRRGLDLSRLLGAQTSVAPGLVAEAWRAVHNNRPDVIHASSIHFFGSIVAATVATIARIPMAAGCAVVATSIPANAELINQGETGLLTPCRDVDALASALLRLADNPELRKRLGEAARERALLSSWDTTAAGTGAVLRRAAGRVAS